jgi:hypothetical protein
MRKNPAEYVIEVFGGVRAAASAIGRSPGAVCNWKRLGNGFIPNQAQQIILKVARRRKLPITPLDLICGRDVQK